MVFARKEYALVLVVLVKNHHKLARKIVVQVYLHLCKKKDVLILAIWMKRDVSWDMKRDVRRRKELHQLEVVKLGHSNFPLQC